VKDKPLGFACRRPHGLTCPTSNAWVTFRGWKRKPSTRLIHDSTCCDAPRLCIGEVLPGRASLPVAIDKQGESGRGALGRETPRRQDLEPSRDGRGMNNPGYGRRSARLFFRSGSPFGSASESTLRRSDPDKGRVIHCGPRLGLSTRSRSECHRINDGVPWRGSAGWGIIKSPRQIKNALVDFKLSIRALLPQLE